MTAAKKFVLYALAIGALELVPRKLKSGRISPYFFNSGLFNNDKSISQLSKFYAGKIPLRTEVIFGPAYKGIPLAIATTMTMRKKRGISIGFSFNRKETKDHGEGDIIVGHSLAGKKVCIVDDVITTGSSSSEAVKIIRTNGGTPIACVIAFDRQERGIDTKCSAVQEFELNYNIPLASVATLANLIEVLEKDAESGTPTVGKALKKILRYRDKYGIR